MSIEYKCVLLPTDKKAVILFTGWKLRLTETDQYGMILYIVSNEEIKAGDWFIVGTDVQRRVYDKSVIPSASVKVVACTDPDMNLLIIPRSFVETYISYYNANDIITDVTVEFENTRINKVTGTINLGLHDTLHYISITPVKSSKYSWNKDEVRKLVIKAMVFASTVHLTKEELHKWIDNNLK